MSPTQRDVRNRDCDPAHWAGCNGTENQADCVHCHIRHLTICSAFEPAELAHVERIVTHRQVAVDRQLFQEDEPSEYVYNLASGAMRLCKLLADGRRQITGFALPGDFLGLATRGRYSYSAEAISDVTVCRFKRSELTALFQRFPQMERRLLGLANDELAAAQDQMLLLGRKTPVEKVASFLFTLSKRLERLNGPTPIFTLPMARADIADFLGLTVETVSRSFTKLKGAHAIALPAPERVQFTNRHVLEALATGEITL